MSLAPLILAPLALLAGGCGSKEKQIEGSLSTMIDLKYQNAVLDYAPLEGPVESVSVRFARPAGEGEDTVLKVTADLVDTGFESGAAIDLAEILPGDGGTQRGVFSRNVFDDPKQSFPKLQRGRLIVNGNLAPGEKVSGEFSGTFENGVDVASGRTVFGNFEGDVP